MDFQTIESILKQLLKSYKQGMHRYFQTIESILKQAQ